MKKRQHYLPKAYLDFFSAVEHKKTKVYALFCNSNTIEYVSTNDICNQRYLYEQIVDTRSAEKLTFFAPNELENSFVHYEGDYATIITQIINDIETKNVYLLKPEEVEVLTFNMSLLVFRHPLFVKI